MPKKHHDQNIPWIVACRNLAAFMLSTTFGYVIYELFLRSISPYTLVFGTFFSTFIWYWLDPKTRKRLFDWHPELSRITIFHSLFYFGYWFSFWLGMKSTDSTLAMGFISLTIAITPLSIRIFERQWTITILVRLIAVAVIMLAAIAMMRLNIPTKNMTLTELQRNIFAIPLFPAWCMLLAVACEAGQEICKVYIAGAVRAQRIRYRDYAAITYNGRRPDEDAVNAMTYESIPIVVIFSTFFLLLYANFHVSYGDFLKVAWYGSWLFVLGIIGAASRLMFVNPLVARRLDYEAIPPWLAIRLAVFYVIGLLVNFLAPFIVSLLPVGACNTPVSCRIPVIHALLRLDLIPDQTSDTYVISLFIMAMIFVIRTLVFIRNGFSITSPTNGD